MVLSTTDLDNFFNLRLAKGTKPDTRLLAEKMKEAFKESKPAYRYAHVPLLSTFDNAGLSERETKLVCAARLARYSYMKWTDDITKDLNLANKLVTDKHASPFEHIAVVSEEQKYFANFNSWIQFRKELGL